MKNALLPYLFITLVCISSAWSESKLGWKLPQDLNDSNTTLRFEVDSTWHMVHGTTKNIHGRVWLGSPSDLLSVNAEIRIPILNFDTDNGSRDKKMRKVMGAADFPEVIVTTNSTEGGCSAEQAQLENGCSGYLIGSLEVKGVRQPLKLPYHALLKDGQFEISGSYTFEWAAFGVEDPSIFVARLDPKVTVIYSCTIQPTELT